MNFDQFRAKYPELLRMPRGTDNNSDEARQMTRADGLRIIGEASDAEVQTSAPPRARRERGNLYLWVIAERDVRYALEQVPFGKNLQKKVIKHTNLTGAERAYCGGELWFLNPAELLVGGNSGRYRIKTSDQLADVALSFKSEGFRVASLGYDEGSGKPAKVLLGELEWL